jgi:hypothetical protein
MERELRHPLLFLLITVMAAAGMFLTETAQAATTYTWYCTNNSWDIATCWSPNGTPTSSDNVVVNPVSGSDTLLTINSGTGTASALSMAVDSTTINTVTLQQSGGSLSAVYEFIGYSGTGTFTQSGGTNNVSSLQLGANGSDGTYDLSGGTVSTNVTVVGGTGTGSVIHTGGTFTVTTGDLTLGSGAGGLGTYDLSGTGLLRADLNINNREIIGRWGTGVFTQTGGENKTIQLILGQFAGSDGTYNLDGGILRGAITVGDEGAGTFNHTNGTYAEGDILVGATGTYNLSGGQIDKAAFNATVEGAFVQTGGTNNIGTITVRKSGSYEMSGSSALSAYGITIGAFSGDDATFTQTTGTTTVTGDLRLGNNSATAVGSFNLESGSLSVDNEIVGWAGQGTFTQNGGTHSVTNSLRLGDLDSGDGHYYMNDGSLTATQMEIGGSYSHSGGGTGVFTQTGGVVDIAGIIRIGTTGIGGGGHGTMNITGGTIHSAVGSIGATNVTGAVTVSGNGVWDNTNTGTSNAGRISIGNGSLTVADTGRVIATTVQASGVNSMITGHGTIEANVENFNEAIVAPGLSGPGVLDIIGDYSQDTSGQGWPDGTLAIELGGLVAGTEYDVLNVSGTATLDGILNVNLLDLGGGMFSPQAGDSFDILSADQILGSFSSQFMAALDPGLNWDIAYLTDAYGSTDVVRLSVASVPEPASLLLLGSGLVGLIGFRKRRG